MGGGQSVQQMNSPFDAPFTDSFNPFGPSNTTTNTHTHNTAAMAALTLTLTLTTILTHTLIQTQPKYTHTAHANGSNCGVPCPNGLYDDVFGWAVVDCGHCCGCPRPAVGRFCVLWVSECVCMCVVCVYVFMCLCVCVCVYVEGWESSCDL